MSWIDVAVFLGLLWGSTLGSWILFDVLPRGLAR